MVCWAHLVGLGLLGIMELAWVCWAFLWSLGFLLVVLASLGLFVIPMCRCLRLVRFSFLWSGVLSCVCSVTPRTCSLYLTSLHDTSYFFFSHYIPPPVYSSLIYS